VFVVKRPKSKPKPEKGFVAERPAGRIARWYQRRARTGFVSAPKFDNLEWFTKRFGKTGVVVAMSKQMRWAVGGALVVLGGLTLYAVNGSPGGDGRTRTMAAAPVTTVVAPTTTTTAAPTTTTLPLDDPAVCDARAAVTSASLMLEENMDGGSVVETLETIAGGLDVMSAASDHPDLVSAAQTMAPVVDEALGLVTAGPSQDLNELAASPEFVENPIFADSAILESMETFFAYDLNCASA